jgi:cell division protease FtsH
MAFSKRPRLLEPNVEGVVYARGIQNALGDLSAIAEIRPPVVVLRIPKGADEEGYLNAAALQALAAPAGEKLRAFAPRRDRKGVVDFEDVMAELAEGRGMMVLVQRDQPVPTKLLAAADVIADIAPVATEDLRVAAREVMSLRLTERQALQLLALPQDAMLAAMRPGRTFAQILNATLAADVGRPETGPRLEVLGGYGDAKLWGLDLAEDVRSWRRGEIGWNELDAGLLLSGPPGTGKTLFAGALARSCDLAFVATSVAQWQATGHLGDLLHAMRASFKAAIDRAPSLLFLDEFDSIGDRTQFSSDHASYSTQVVNGLLECMDGSTRREGVVVVGATNRPQAIDAAFLRPGRLGRHIRIELPDEQNRREIAGTYLKGTLSPIEIARVAGATEGMSGAEIEGVVKEARRLARRAKVSLNVSLVLSCLPPSLPLVGRERWIASVHEAGHAVVGLTVELGNLKGVAIVSEVRRTQKVAGGAFFQSRVRIIRSKESYLDEICLRLAGIAAEKVVIGSVTDGAGATTGSDLAVATDLATLMVAEFGMGGSLRYLHTAGVAERQQLRRRNRDVDREVSSMLAVQLARAEAIVRERLDAVEAVARLLDEKGFLAGDEVETLVSAEETRRRAS